MSNFQSDVTAKARDCSHCKAVVIEEELTHCPLCHHSLPSRVKEVISDDAIRGRGEENPAIAGWVALYLANAALSVILAFTWGQTTVSTGFDWHRGVMTTTNVRNEMFAVFIVLAIVEVILAPLVASAISSTYIKVDKSGVSGRGISKWFYLCDLRRFDFMLSFDQISVSAKNNHLIIHGPGTHYYVYCKNPVEIQKAIHEQRSNVSKAST
ncbi:MAG: hypothetical protein FWE21_07675 [Defluviitaleaceae bacterium]|nr:hypothetical protein [Defluviitaleaceae bacterium]